MSKDIEIELKLPLQNAATIIRFLTKEAAFKYEASQYDVYYNPPHRNFLKDRDNVYEWLRLRRFGDKAQITYKDWVPHEAQVKTHATEYETDIASYDQLTKILHALDFKELIVVRKLRKAWGYMDSEVSIDVVDELGTFIEIEYKGELENVMEAREHLDAVLKKIGAKTGELDTRGYPYLLLEKKGLLG